MRKVSTYFLILITILLVFSVAVQRWSEWWVNKNLPLILNANPDREYDVQFDQVQFDLIKRVILIEEVKIRPIGAKKSMSAEATVHQAFLSGIDPFRLFWDKNLQIGELMFSSPYFKVHFLPDSTSEGEKAGNALQGLFGDILSRGEIQNFQVGRANAQFYSGDSLLGELINLNLIATGLRTDSVRWTNPIPFDYDRIRISLDRLDYRFENGQELKVGKVSFDTDLAEVKVREGFSLKFAKDIRKVAQKMDFQTDLIEVEVDSLMFSGLEANTNLYSDLDIRAQKLHVFGLDFLDFRDKNKPRGTSPVKPMFQGLIQKIHFPLKLDTFKISNGKIQYSESVPGESETWRFQIDHLDGELIKLTSIDELQQAFGQVEGDFKGKIEGHGMLSAQVKVPFDREEFDMQLELTDFDLTRLNEILMPVMHGDIVSGKGHRLHVSIRAKESYADATMIFDYEDLKVELFKKGTQRKNRLVSTLANFALHKSNLPTEKKYRKPSFQVARDIHRGPFHLVWKSTKEGIIQVVPTATVQRLLESSEK